MDYKGPAIEVEGLVAVYDERVILDDISFQVQPEETLVILGGSGCGKSTLLNNLIGLMRPLKGSIKIFGQEIVNMKEDALDEIRKRFGMLFQGSALFNSMTVGDNICLPLREHTKLDEQVIKIMSRIKLDQVGLGGFEKLMPSELSGGMKKRAALARAMAMDPELLYFDEPSAGLDPIVAAGIDELILKMKKSFRMTQVVVTHEMGSAFTIADKMLMLHKGKVIFHGSPDDIKRSKHPRVMQFLSGQPDSDQCDQKAFINSLTV